MMPSVDESAARLKAKGWHTGDVAFTYPTGRVWIVHCWRAGFSFTSEAPTQSEAWAIACRRAEAMEN